MPSFSNFEYFFVVDQLKFSKSSMFLTQIVGASGLMVVPYFYQKLFRDVEFKYNFYSSQIIFMIAISTFLVMALRLNEGTIPDLVLYVICGPIA